MASGMTSTSLRHLLEAGEGGRYRTHVASGLSNWRMVVERDTNNKFICCKGKCPGAPHNAPAVNRKGWQQILYQTTADPFDMHPIADQPQVVKRLRPLLPVAFGCGERDVRDEVAQSEKAVPCVEDIVQQQCAAQP